MSDAVTVLALAGPWLAQFPDLAGMELVVTLPDGRRCTLCAGLGHAVTPAGARCAPGAPPGAHTAHNLEAGPAAPPAAEAAAPAPAPAPPLAFNLRAKHKAILAAASAEPLTRKALILRARVAYTPDARRCLAQLVRAGLLEAVAAGVRLPRTTARTTARTQ